MKSLNLPKKEMMMLHSVDKPGSDVDSYVTSLAKILDNKQNMITTL